MWTVGRPRPYHRCLDRDIPGRNLWYWATNLQLKEESRSVRRLSLSTKTMRLCALTIDLRHASRSPSAVCLGRRQVALDSRRVLNMEFQHGDPLRMAYGDR